MIVDTEQDCRQRTVASRDQADAAGLRHKTGAIDPGSHGSGLFLQPGGKDRGLNGYNRYCPRIGGGEKTVDHAVILPRYSVGGWRELWFVKRAD
jgi:hypothetical protein